MTEKSDRIAFIVKYLQDKYGEEKVVINDHWGADFHAIGLRDKSGQHLAYISTIGDKDNDYYLALENPPVDDDFPYSPAGDFNNISLTELESLITKHLRLTEDERTTLDLKNKG